MGMSAGGPDLIQDGLVLCLDAGDRNSYQSGSLRWFDLSGNNNSGSLVNGPTFNTGSFGSIVFDGTNDYVRVLDNGSGSVFQTNQYTIEASVYIVDNTSISRNIWSYDYTTFAPPYYSQQFRIGGTGFNNGLLIGYNINGTYYHLTAEGYLTVLDRWYVLTGIITSGRQELYINGVRVANTSNVISQINYYNQVVNIGKLSTVGGDSWNGRIANIKFYNRALSAQEVQQNYNAQKSRFGLT